MVFTISRLSKSLALIRATARMSDLHNSMWLFRYSHGSGNLAPYKYLTISFIRFSSTQFQHSTVLQLRLHSYGYAPYIASCIALNLNTIIIKELIDMYLFECQCYWFSVFMGMRDYKVYVFCSKNIDAFICNFNLVLSAINRKKLSPFVFVNRAIIIQGSSR